MNRSDDQNRTTNETYAHTGRNGSAEDGSSRYLRKVVTIYKIISCHTPEIVIFAKQSTLQIRNKQITIEHNFIKYSYSYMLRPYGVIIRLTTAQCNTYTSFNMF
jgi:hypothetical protein